MQFTSTASLKKFKLKKIEDVRINSEVNDVRNVINNYNKLMLKCHNWPDYEASERQKVKARMTDNDEIIL